MLSVKALFTKVLVWIYGMTHLVTPTIVLANTTQESVLSNDSLAIQLDDGVYIVFLHVKLHTTTARTNIGAFRLTVGNDKIRPVAPTNYTGILNSTMTGFYPTYTGNEYWMTYSGTWNANANIELWGSGIFYTY